MDEYQIHMKSDSEYLREVRDHYEEYPYPERDPLKEKEFLRAPFTDRLDHVNYYCFEGKKDFGADSQLPDSVLYAQRP